MANGDVLFFVRLRQDATARIALVATTDSTYNPIERGRSLAALLLVNLDAATLRALVERLAETTQAQPSTPPTERPKGRSRF